ncbi:hypothetical protein FNYG_13309 [Fusarium nygamai]|uniref:Heterokaryon incompatibility domain-containing protein n=1 Tax=Gibberella nygamai TaxID=42673 RepID=A0A2K0VTK1_GIBNY|nr:hypothetical protein FNYG_13309 [Fusarium nygamai]
MSGPKVRMCRFSASANLTLEFEKVDIQKSCYFAISHVWGSPDEIICRQVPELGNVKLHISERKLDFIKGNLRKHVGTSPFWMDILCISQNNRDEKAEVISHIPRIFAGATKVIAIREGDGLKPCCMTLLGDLGMNEFHTVFKHIHSDHLCENLTESFLERLWTLQELVLCRSIEFTSCEDWVPKKRTEDLMEATISCQQTFDRLRALAQAWVNPTQEPQISEEEEIRFMLAFFRNGTITRNQAPVVDRLMSPSEDKVLLQEVNSTRVATECQDFIFAVMPQYGWWQMNADDRKEMKVMEFSELFNKVQAKALEANHGFRGRFTRGMTESGPLDSNSAWLPSLQLPVPRYLGDFVKLLGGPCAPSSSGRQGAPLNRVIGYELDDNLPFEGVFQILKTSMETSNIAWKMAQLGELSAYGKFPPERFTILGLDECEDHETAEYQWLVCSEEGYFREMEQDVISAVSAMFSAVGLDQVGGPLFESQWNHYQRYLVAARPPLYRLGMMTVAAIIGCSIPLSALEWVWDRFSPVLLNLAKGQNVLGLVSKSYIRHLRCEVDGTLSSGQSRLMQFSWVRRGEGPMGGVDVVLVPASGCNLDEGGMCDSKGPVGIMSSFYCTNVPVDLT